jgi:hypothetical protein
VKIFETEAALAQANLQAGQLVRTKSYENTDDGISTLWRIAASGDGVTLANGNVAIPYSDTSAKMRKNYIINGDMSVWQRGVNFEDSTIETFTADRWYMPSQRSVKRANGDFPPNQGFINSLRAYMTGNTSADNMIIKTFLETGGTGKCGPYIKGKTMTFSGWLKADVGRNINGVLRFVDDKYNTNSIDILNPKVIHTGTGDWVKFKETFTIDVDPNPTNIAVYVGLYTDVDSVVTEFLVTGLQLEDGPVDTPFEFLQQQEKIALCHRYFFRSPYNWIRQRSANPAGSNITHRTTQALPQRMRTVPTSKIIGYQSNERIDTAPTIYVPVDPQQFASLDTVGIFWVPTGSANFWGFAIGIEAEAEF